MLCKSCKEDVPPKFAHAISVNMCPLCGEEIMSLKLKDTLNNLKSLMSDSVEFQTEIEDWLYSNYSLKKVDKSLAVSSAEYDQPIKIAGQTPTQATTFIKRSGVDIDKIKKAVDDIKNGRNDGPSEMMTDDEEMDQYQVPISSREAEEMKDLFASSTLTDVEFSKNDSPTSHIEKLKRLQSQQDGGGNRGGFIRRS